MSQIVDVLERLGQDATLRNLDRARLEQVLVEASLDPGARAAILSQDPREIEAVLGAAANQCCLIVVPEGR